MGVISQERVEFDLWFQELERALQSQADQPEKQLEIIDELVARLDLDAELFQSSSEQAGSTYSIKGLCRNRQLAVITITLGQGAIIPPHNHPGMVGYLRVLSGKVKVTNFKLPARGPVYHLEREGQQVLIAGDSVSLTPYRSNIHQVEALELSQVLDIFTPDYGLRRLPTNYEIITPTDGPFQGVRQVKPTFVRILKVAFKRWQEKQQRT